MANDGLAKGYLALELAALWQAQAVNTFLSLDHPH